MSKETKTEARTMTERQRDQAIQHADTLRTWRDKNNNRPLALRPREIGPVVMMLGYKDANKLYFDFNPQSKLVAVYLHRTR